MTASISVCGKYLTAQEIIEAIQKHLGTEGDRPGDITHVFRTCHQWQEKEKGVPYHWKCIEKEYREYMTADEIPDCVLFYYAEVVELGLTSQPLANDDPAVRS